MTEALDTHQFYLQTKSFQDQATTFAMKQAEKLVAQNHTLIKVNIASLAVCRKAYNMFKSNLEKAFPSPTYTSLITLTLQSRENAFFVDLKDRLITAFNEANNRKII